MNVPPDRYAAARSGARKLLWTMLFLLLALAVLYGLFVRYYNYSSGERAGWVQKFSKKGWLCKTWEGELALVTMPGTAQEKFYFTVLDEDVAEQLNRAMGKRVSLHYVEKVGIPSTCFGETRHYVNEVRAVEDIPLAPGIVVPNRPAGAGDSSPAAPGGVVSPPPASAPAQPETAPATPIPGTPSTVPSPSSGAPGAPAAGSTNTMAPAAATPLAVPPPASGESPATPGAPTPASSAAPPTAAPAADAAANPAPPGTATAR